MVGLVLVSHSRPLAVAVQELVRSMTGPALPLAIAAGAGENHAELGTDAVEILEAIRSVRGDAGVLVLMDMGSAILSSETALDLMDESERANIRFCSAPFVEGAVAAGVTANLGASLDDVQNEALGALTQKQAALKDGPSAGTSAPPARPKPAEAARTLRLTVRNAHGVHARPAARLIAALKPFAAEITVRNLSNSREAASARSLSALALLEILQDHEIEVAATGPDAEAALRKIGELARAGFGEPLPSGKSPATIDPPSAGKKSGGPISLSDGLAVGPVRFLRAASFDVPRTTVDEPATEIARLRQAVATVQSALEKRGAQMAGQVGGENAEIFRAQIEALHDPALIDAAIRAISTEHPNAARAWFDAYRPMVERYAALSDSYLRERAADLADIGGQVLEQLGLAPKEGAALREPAILVADDLTPRQVSALDRKTVLGVVLLDGGPTAHASIILRALGVPAMIQARGVLDRANLRDGDILAFDGATGKIWPAPKDSLLADLRRRQDQQRAKRIADEQAAARPGATLDGRRIEIFANIGHAGEAAQAARAGAEGVGLLRTEFLFLHRVTAPGEDEQVQALRDVACSFGDRPVVVRTLDIGGDKEVAYLRLPHEDNPFLGVRALRLCLRHEELFATQLRALLRAAHHHPHLKIMFPMVADIDDLRRARVCLEKAHIDLQREAVPHRWPVEAGIMIEIPSAALQAEFLAEAADFFSIGTNDLTQYTLAADRGNPDLGAYQDALHPSVLRLIDLVVRGAEKYHRPVAVCGEAAADEAAALVLAGLGVTELSVSAVRIPRLKAALRAHKFGALRELATAALACQSAAEVRKLIGKIGGDPRREADAFP
jgi:phosphocarrier protein FPr